MATHLLTIKYCRHVQNIHTDYIIKRQIAYTKSFKLRFEIICYTPEETSNTQICRDTMVENHCSNPTKVQPNVLDFYVPKLVFLLSLFSKTVAVTNTSMLCPLWASEIWVYIYHTNLRLHFKIQFQIKLKQFYHSLFFRVADGALLST